MERFHQRGADPTSFHQREDQSHQLTLNETNLDNECHGCFYNNLEVTLWFLLKTWFFAAFPRPAANLRNTLGPIARASCAAPHFPRQLPGKPLPGPEGVCPRDENNWREQVPPTFGKNHRGDPASSRPRNRTWRLQLRARRHRGQPAAAGAGLSPGDALWSARLPRVCPGLPVLFQASGQYCTLERPCPTNDPRRSDESATHREAHVPLPRMLQPVTPRMLPECPRLWFPHEGKCLLWRQDQGGRSTWGSGATPTLMAQPEARAQGPSLALASQHGSGHLCLGLAWETHF